MEPIESHADRVERLFHEALEIDAGPRETFLAGACGGDESLRLAVQKLLDAFARVGQKPAWSMPALQNEALSTGGCKRRYAGALPSD